MILGIRYVEVTPYIFVERSIRDMHIEMQGPTIIVVLDIRPHSGTHMLHGAGIFTVPTFALNLW